MNRVLVHPASYGDIAAAVARAFELFPLELRGKRVLVKPNVLRSAAPAEGITTHPALVRAVVEQVEACGPASIVVGDNPGLYNYGANENGFASTGLRDAARGHYRNIGLESVKVAFPERFMPAVSLSRAVVDADCIISLPKFKTHGLTVLTGAIKNSYGFLPGAQKAMLHKAAGSPERFHELVVEVFRLRVPDLFIVDAVVGMEGNGPASPDLREIGCVIAGDNAVAVDAVIATMMGCDPGRLGFLRHARAAGLGEYDLAALSIIGDVLPIPGFRLPPLGGEAVAGNPGLQSALHQRAVARPGADPTLCTACGLCVEQCPVSALTLVDELPRVDAAACIACFCCQELCPEKAMRLS